MHSPTPHHQFRSVPVPSRRRAARGRGSGYGKTTTAARLAAQVDRLDVPDVAATYRADPDAALRRAGRPLLLDEWQQVPEVLAAVKRSVDSDRTPGQFLLTGSIRATTELSTWAGTGRVVRIGMHPLTEREVTGQVRDDDLVTALCDRWLDAIPTQLPALDIDAYLRLALVVDLGRGRPFGIEVKAGAAPTRQDARHLIWLRDELGKNFAGGVVLHSGQAVVELEDRIAAVPLSAAWTRS